MLERKRPNRKRIWNMLPAVLVFALLGCAWNTATAQMIWSEEFNSGMAPDPTVWSYDLGATGWGNQELQQYTDDPANVKVEGGHLVITVREQQSGAPFTSARIRTQDKVTFRYGTIEARIQVPDLANGLWPAFWTMGNSFGDVGWPDCGEIDILEMGSSGAISAGTINRRASSAAHWERNGNHALYSRFLDAPANIHGEFHVLRMDWTPGSITSYLDDTPIWTMDISDAACADCSELHEPHFVILNMAVGGNFTGILSESGITAPRPAELRVDWIRIYDNGFTELGGSAIEGTPDVAFSHSGSWFNDGQSGHGFSIEIGELGGEPFAVVYWYTYDSLGNPMFLVGTGTPDGNVLEVTFESPYGMIFGVFDPTTVERPDGGTGRFDFSDPDNATFSYTPSVFNTDNRGHTSIVDLPVTKLFGIGSP
jgi:beta-glucanase (GH16 family)